jgi:preprotein translocase subunit Sec61beta
MAFVAFLGFRGVLFLSQDKISAPSSSTGLIRFYDVTSSKILLDPKVVVGATLVFIALELLLQTVKF